MNARQALWWEELRVGGPIAATCLVAGLAGQASLGLCARAWHAVDSQMLAATLGVPMMLALVLTLNTANTGHLAGGFSRRILRLPVDTRTAVAVALLTRLILVGVSAGILIVVCWLLYGRGPGPRAILFLAGTYLLIQVLDWSRAVAAWLAPVVILLFVYVLSVSPGGLNAWVRALSAEGAGVTSSSLVAFGLGLMLAYALSLFFVSRTRRGRRFSLAITQTFNEALALPWTRSKGPFASPLAAQIWCERKRSGFSFPALVIVFWLLCLVVRWLAVESLSDVNLSSHKEAPVFFDPSWSFDIPPLIALAFASFAWTLRREMTRAGKGSPFAYMRWLPLHNEERARASLAVAGRNLGVCLAVITVLSAVSLLFAGGGWVGKLFGEALHRGETNLREVLAVLLGPSLLAALVCWIILGTAGRLLRRRSLINGLILAFAIALGAWLVAGSLPNGVPRNMATGIGCMILVFAVLLPPSVLIARLDGAWRRGLLTLPMVAVNVFLWGLVTIFLFPFSFEAEWFRKLIFLPMSLALAALAVSPYVNGTVAFAYRSADACVANEKPPVRLRNTKRSPLTRAFVTLTLLAVVAFLAWLRWPAESVWQRTWRAQGLPTTLQELDDWYTPVPPDRNLAVLYLKASGDCRRKELQWERQKASLGNQDLSEKIAVVRGADFGRTEQIPPDVWRWTKKYWDAVTREVCPDLHAAAHSGLTASRYPADLRRGFAVDLEYLAGIKALGRQLALDSLVAGVEGRSDASVDAILDLFPLANSLENEPLLISQFLRASFLGMAETSLEVAVNRVALSDVQLRRLQDGFSHALPPIEQHRIMDRATIAEEVMVLRYYPARLSLSEGATRNSLAALLTDGCWAPLSNLTGFDTFNRVMVTSYMAGVRESSRLALERRRPIEVTVPYTFWTSPAIVFKGCWAAMMMLSFDRAYDSEWGWRTQMDLAQTALAVERFRLANGRLPATLDELIPTYLDRIPLDFWNPGQPLSYLIKDNGEFVVYSCTTMRANRPSEAAPEDPRLAAYVLTFTVAPPEIRTRPSRAD